MPHIKELENHPLFQNLESRYFDLVKEPELGKFQPGETICSPNDFCNSIGIILKGSLKFVHITSSGKEILIKRMSKGEIFGELLCFQGRKYPNWVISLSDSEVVFISRNILHQLLQNEFFFNSFMKLLGIKSGNLLQKIDILSLNKVEERVAYYLMNIGNFATISDLSSYIGCSREATSRALSKLRKEIDITSIKDLELILYGG